LSGGGWRFQSLWRRNLAFGFLGLIRAQKYNINTPKYVVGKNNI